MDIITQTRELAKTLQNDPVFIRLGKAGEKNDADVALGESIVEFNNLRSELSMLATNPDKDNDKMMKLNEELRERYASIMSNPNMIEYNDAKTEADSVLAFMVQILQAGANGIDPDSVEQADCGGSCASCAGCG